MASNQVLFDKQSKIHIYIKAIKTKSGVGLRECEIR